MLSVLLDASENKQFPSRKDCKKRAPDGAHGKRKCVSMKEKTEKQKPKEKSRELTRLITAVGGLCAGFFNGLFGAGGGMLAVPALEFSGLEVEKSHATSVALILPLCIFSSVLYLLDGRVQIHEAFPYLPGGIIGAVIGATLLCKLSSVWIKRIFGLLMMWAGIRMILS